jgi:hypothetical protein
MGLLLEDSGSDNNTKDQKSESEGEFYEIKHWRECRMWPEYTGAFAEDAKDCSLLERRISSYKTQTRVVI